MEVISSGLGSITSILNGTVGYFHNGTAGYCIPTFQWVLLLFYKCKNIFTKMLRDVGMEVPKSIETRSKYTMHAFKGRG